MEIKLIPLEEKYLKQLHEIENLCFAVPWTIEDLTSEVKNKAAYYLLACLEEKVIGYGGFWKILEEGHITNIAVLPEYRTSGVGNLVLSSLITLAKELKITAMTLEVRRSNIPAQGLYSKHGFVNVGMRKKYYSDNNEDAIIMWNYNLY